VGTPHYLVAHNGLDHSVAILENGTTQVVPMGYIAASTTYERSGSTQ
jgi:hypothetical protein